MGTATTESETELYFVHAILGIWKALGKGVLTAHLGRRSYRRDKPGRARQ